MPSTSYTVQQAVALGEQPALGNLRVTNDLCGHVVRVNCGGDSVDAVVASTCDIGSTNCGVDMIRKTWDIATTISPGIATCSISLTARNPMPGGMK
eukprot:Pgem_evm1s5068